MKRILFYIISFILIICSCKDYKNKEEMSEISNGIDSQLLELVDSVYSKRIDRDHFMTFSCYSYNDTTYLNITNGLSFPIECFTVTKCPTFVGYKKYNDVYLVFYDKSKGASIHKFVKKDSLVVDEYPFEHYKVYDVSSKIIDPVAGFERNYRIDEQDSLIFVNNGFPPPH